MLEDVELGFDQNRMVYSACRNCSCFRAICLDDNKGFCCSEGKAENFFIPFGYPLLDTQGKKRTVLQYQENPLPEDCKFHTQCSMLNFMEDESAIDEIVSEEFETIETTVGELDLSDVAFKDIIEKDSTFENWCKDVKDAPAVLLKKDGAIHGFVIMTIEKDYDYSWILPMPPQKYYFQKGDRRLGIRWMWADDEIHNAKQHLMSMAFLRACIERVDEIYVVSYMDTYELYRCSGFKPVGYMMGGDGNDDDTGAHVMVKRLNDLEKCK